MPKQKRTFHGVSRHFRTLKVPTKLNSGKLCCIWTQWTWKPSPRFIGFDADENGQSRKAHPKFLSTLYIAQMLSPNPLNGCVFTA